MESSWSGAGSVRESGFTEQGGNPLRVIVQKGGRYCLYLDHYRGGTLVLNAPRSKKRAQQAYQLAGSYAVAL